MENKEKFTYQDVSIVPAVVSEIEHRSECDPFVDLNKLPLFTAPMDSVVDEKSYVRFKQNGITPIIPRTVELEKRLELCALGEWIALSLDEFRNYIPSEAPSGGYGKVLIDVANGHMKIIYDLVKEKKCMYPGIVVMVGNIANPETYKIANESKVDYIRCGIGAGRGCFVGSTLVTMRDGTMKQIKDIIEEEIVETYLDISADLTCDVRSRKEIETDTLLDVNGIKCTPNHKFLVVRWVDVMDNKITPFFEEARNITTDLRLVRLSEDGETHILEIPIIKEIKLDKEEVVYDIEVAYANSYLVGEDRYIVHNCITSSNTAIHYPMASLIQEIKGVKNSINGKTKIVADGGIRNYSDIIKALALGADYVMCGSIFSQMLDAGGNLVVRDKHTNYFGPWDKNIFSYKDGKIYVGGYESEVKKVFYGMASKDGQKAIGGEATKTAEGISMELPVKYDIAGWTKNMISYLRSAMSYTNCRTLRDFIGKPEIINLSPGVVGTVNK